MYHVYMTTINLDSLTTLTSNRLIRSFETFEQAKQDLDYIDYKMTETYGTMRCMTKRVSTNELHVMFYDLNIKIATKTIFQIN